MFITRNTNLAIIVFMTLAACYFVWTASESSECVTIGIEHQTRTTWAPVGGCKLPDDFAKPWTAITREP